MDKKITVEGIELNISQAIKRVKKDIEDDWFKDPFMFSDYLKDDFVLEKIKNFDVSTYPEKSKEYFDIPKQDFVLRYSIETNIIDRVLFQALVDIIAKDLDSALGVEIYSHRITNDRERDNYFFRHPVEQWRSFNNDVKIELDKEKSQVLLVTDLTNFYENIDVKELEDKLIKIINELGIADSLRTTYRKVAEILRIILMKWAGKKTGCGIPQNRNPSSFLANMYLHNVDQAMKKLGYKYFRYMDDIRFVCDNKYVARRLLKNLIAELREIGLNVNAKKTKILYSDDVNISNWLPNPDREIEQIDALFKTRNLLDIKKAIPLLEKKTIQLIHDNKTGSRQFRFCVQRYVRLLRVDEIKDSINAFELIPKIIDELLEQPWSTDSFFKFLECVELSNSHCRRIAHILVIDLYSTYEWQLYYLWQLLIAKQYKSDKLLEMARQKIRNEHINKPQTAGCCLYLSSLGSIEDKHYIAKNFIIFKDFFTQRYALIAVKDLPYKEYIEPYVKDHVLPEYVGTFRGLKETFPSVFYIPPEPIHYRNLYNELPEIRS